MAEPEPICELSAGEQTVPAAIQQPGEGPGGEPHELLTSAITSALATLTYREREITKLRYGLEDGFSFTYDQIGRIFKTTTSRVKSIEKRALRKLQHPARSRQLEHHRDVVLTHGPVDPEGYYYLLQEIFGGAFGDRKPSLFRYAKGERAQDAFICWLLAWADKRQRGTDSLLHQTGMFFLKCLLDLHGIETPGERIDIEIRPQYAGLDVLVLVDREVAVLIEDKTDSSEHSDQLRRYLEFVKLSNPNWQCAPIYFKSGQQTCFRSVEAAGWKCFLRKDLLRVLAHGRRLGVKNDIFDDFHGHILRRDLKAWRNRTRRMGQGGTSSADVFSE